MKATTRIITWTFVLLMALPAAALPQGRYYYRLENKQAAYRAGYDEGYRDGMRQANFDLREHRRFNYHTPQYISGGFYNQRFGGDFRKGYKKGYREGYESFSRGYFRNPRGRW